MVIGATCLGDDDLGAVARPVVAFQHGLLGAFDVDLEEVDLATPCSRQIARSVVTGIGNDFTGLLNSFCAACALASTVVESAVEALDQVIDRFAGRRADQRFDPPVARPHRRRRAAPATDWARR